MQLRFLPQTLLDEWMDQGKVDLKLNHLLDLSTRRVVPVREALHFVGLASGADSGLTNKVKTLDFVRSMGAEYFQTSVVVGETAYEVIPGWIIEDESACSATSAPTVSTPPINEQLEGERLAAVQLAAVGAMQLVAGQVREMSLPERLLAEELAAVDKLPSHLPVLQMDGSPAQQKPLPDEQSILERLEAVQAAVEARERTASPQSQEVAQPRLVEKRSDQNARSNLDALASLLLKRLS